MQHFFSLIPPLENDTATINTSVPNKDETSDKFPRTLTSLYDYNNKALSNEELEIKSHELFANCTCTE